MTTQKFSLAGYSAIGPNSIWLVSRFYCVYSNIAVNFFDGLQWFL